MSDTALNGTVTALRIAVVGSGPSGFYAIDALFKQKTFAVEVDLFDRLPTPFGLVRGGVAPDHGKIKEVTRIYERIAADPRFRFFGNITIGENITPTELQSHYHAVIYAIGAETDKKLGIPGEDLPGSHAATEFVGWYNAHPDYRDRDFDLSKKRVAVIGNGNVAMDVARILGSSYDELYKTDIADYALDALRDSHVTEIYMLGRRGPAQAAFTNKELKEFGELPLCDVIIDPVEGQVDALSTAWIQAHHDPEADKNIATLTEFLHKPPEGKPRRIIMRFLLSPVEIIGDGKVEAIKVVKNELVQSSDGSLRAKATDRTETILVDLVFRSIGYTGVALAGLPFDNKAGVIPNIHGRVIDPLSQEPIDGLYCTGWIKRGANGIIGDNRKDSVETVNALIEDMPMLIAPSAEFGTRESIEALIEARKPDYVSFKDWQALDQAELSNGAAIGRPRLKFSRVADMLDAVKATRTQPTP